MPDDEVAGGGETTLIDAVTRAEFMASMETMNSTLAEMRTMMLELMKPKSKEPDKPIDLNEM